MLVGRGRERLRVLLANAVEGRPEARVIRGEPGMGKISLLHAASEDANELQVVRFDGHEAETEIPYAGLSIVLGPLIEGCPGSLVCRSRP